MGRPTAKVGRLTLAMDWRGYLTNAFAPEYLANWVTALLGFVGAVIAIVTLRNLVKQTRAAVTAAAAAKVSADVARDALYLTESADIQLVETTFDRVYTANEGMYRATLTTIWRNFGRSAAKNVVFDLVFGIPGRPVGTSHSLPTTPPVSIAANQTTTFGFEPLGRIMVLDDVQLVHQAKEQLRLWGTVEYDDIFDRHHRLRVGATWNHGTDSFSWDDFESSIENDVPPP